MTLRESLPLKYRLRQYKCLAGYPTPLDVLYEMCEYVFAQNRRKKKWSSADMFIKLEDARKALPSLNEEELEPKIKDALKKLACDTNYITISETGIAITEAGLAALYE